ncbi:hypothetical protein KW797_01890 [Candidatus Parcubacteria bacterium]|nr:hypothetical protein [Candidatus Parcubacteria bacterium]
MSGKKRKEEKIIEVVPFAKGAAGRAGNTLSYFTAKDLPLGTIVAVPLRGKSILGLVTAAREAADERSALRSSSFKLRKAGSAVGESILSSAFLQSAETLARFYSSSQGEVALQATPKLLFERYKEWHKPRAEKRPRSANLKEEKFVFQREFSERIDSYKSLIRTEFARDASIFMLLPSALEAERMAELLSRGIGSYTFVFHGELGKKETIGRFNKMAGEKHPVLIIATPSFLFIPREDISTLIVEHESSGAYRGRERPYLDFRAFAEVLAEKGGKKLILADTLLRLETLYREERKELLGFAPLKWRLSRTEEGRLVDTREKEKFSLISDEAGGAIRDAITRGKSILVYAARKGFRPVTLCSDCGTTLTCHDCSAALVLHGERAGGRVFICHKCKAERPADATCEHCGGWRLTALGYGTEGVAAELKEKFPDAEIRVLDKDSAPTKAKAKAIVRWLEEGKGRILVGTELALHYTEGGFDTVIVASIDSLMGIPAFRGSERIMRLLLSLRLRSERAFVVQTRLRDPKLITQALEGDLLGFYRREIAERIEYRYPPAVRLVKITLEGRKPALDYERDALMKLLAPYAPETYSAFISKVNGLYRTHVLLRLPPKEWTVPELSEGHLDKRLAAFLRSLPENYTLEVDPEDIL